MNIYTCIYKYICIFIHTYTFMYMNICMYENTNIIVGKVGEVLCIYVYVCMCNLIFVYEYIRVFLTAFNEDSIENNENRSVIVDTVNMHVFVYIHI
jgi:hypothetical protein